MAANTQLANLMIRLGTEFKAAYMKFSGNTTGDLTSLTTTTKTSLLAAINELVTALSNRVLTSAVGANNGIAPLDAGGKIAAAYLPSYVDDVLEFADEASFPAVGETAKIYIALDTNAQYRWSGSAYVNLGGGSGGVVSFNGRAGAVAPADGDYDAFYYTKAETGDPETDYVALFEAALT